MADTLLFRKGPLSGLTSLPIKNGAISITTDEPGIYIDHNGKRSRVGDFITVAKMSDLAQYKLNPANEEDRYNAHALYYVIENDALARWDATAKDFKLINDRTTLVNSLAALNQALTALTGVVGTNTANIDKIAKFENNTLKSGALKDEIDRATAAEEALGKRIDDIVGGEGGDSVASLRAALNKEITDRSEADAQILAKANTAQQEVDALEGVVSTLSGTVNTNKGLLDEEIERAKAAEKVNTDAIADEKDRAMEEEGRLAGLITSNATTAANAVQAEKERAMAAENKIATFGADGAVNGGALKVEIERATTRENAISEVANAAKSKADTNADSIANLVNADTALGQRITDEIAARESADTALGQRIDAVVEEAKTHAKQSALNAVVEDVGELTETVTSQGQTISGIQGNITTLGGKIDDEIKDRKSEIARVEGLISAETSARETAIANEVTARDAAIETAVNAAKSTLNESIASNLQKINANTKSITDEIARAKAAEKANADNITQLGKDLAAEVSRADAAEKANAQAIADEVTARANADTQLQTNINNLDTKLSGAISSEAATRASEDIRILGEAQAYADSRLEAANAMRYMGTVGDDTTDASAKRFEALPTTKVEAGDTYVVVGTDFKIGSKTCKIGDLIVAIADQSGATYPSDLTGWSHVPTGYDASLDQELKVTATTNGAKAALSSVMGATERGSLTIVGNANSNVKAALNTSTNTLTINMEWEEWT